MTKEVIRIDNESIREKTLDLRNARDRFNNIVKQLKLQPVEKYCINDLINVVKQYFKSPSNEVIDKWLKELIVSNAPAIEIAGVELDGKKLVDLVKIKADLADILTAVKEATNIIQFEHLIKKYLVVNKEGNVCFVSNYNSLIKEDCTSYATGKDQVLVLNQIKGLINSINEIEKVAEIKGLELSQDLDNPLLKLPYIIKGENGYIPNIEYINCF